MIRRFLAWLRIPRYTSATFVAHIYQEVGIDIFDGEEDS